MSHPNRPNRNILEGKTFGRLLVISPIREAGKEIKYLCRCSCGEQKEILGQSIRRGLTKSCGCLKREIASQVRHGKSKTRVHTIWWGMVQRCTNPKNKKYPYYGARGITVCRRWLKFENFYEDMGDPPDGLTLERKKNDQGYYKRNCEWATMRTQGNNRRNNKFLTFNGRTQTKAQWAREVGLDPRIFHGRLTRGWSLAEALGKT